MTTATSLSTADAALRGECLHGDDFSDSEIHSWFMAEVDGYAGLNHLDSQTDQYVYSALDAAYAWPHLSGARLRMLGLGSAFGSEFKPIRDRVTSLAIVEPGTRFWRDQVAGIPAHYVQPDPSGALPFADGEFDAATAFGVLHHIPNVSSVLAELTRVIRPGGVLLVREPVTSMGDWRQPRPGLTQHERGLPLGYMRAAAASYGLRIEREHVIGFAPLTHLAARRAGAQPWNSATFVAADSLLSRLFRWNWSYHRTSLLRRFAPSIGFWVLRREADGVRT